MLLIEAALCYNKAPLYCGVSIIANYSECFLGSGISAGSHSNCQFPQLIRGLLYVRNELLNFSPSSSNSASSILTPRSNQLFSCHKVNIGNNSRSTNVSSSCHRVNSNILEKVHSRSTNIQVLAVPAQNVCQESSVLCKFTRAFTWSST